MKYKSEHRGRVRPGKYFASYIWDGDAFDFLEFGKPVGEHVKIRIYGIDAPEHGQPYATEARDELKRLLCARLLIRVHTTDCYGRLISEVYQDYKTRIVDVGREMVISGLAHSEGPYEEEEKEAKKKKWGLWRQEDPVLPFIYRQENEWRMFKDKKK